GDRDALEFPGGIRPPYSALMPANFTTLAHFSVSSAISLPKSAGEPGSTVAPRSARRALILEWAKATLISLLSLSTIWTGVGKFHRVPLPKIWRCGDL